MRMEECFSQMRKTKQNNAIRCHANRSAGGRGLYETEMTILGICPLCDVIKIRKKLPEIKSLEPSEVWNCFHIEKMFTDLINLYFIYN